MVGSILDVVEKEYSTISKAANEFLPTLTGKDIKTDISLAGEMAGLKLLRATGFDHSKIEAGTAILGVIPDEALDLMSSFLSGWANSNALADGEMEEGDLPEDVTPYLPEVVTYEAAFDQICRQNNIHAELVPFVAASAALKLVASGKKLNVLDSQIGLSMVMYHIISGSKTVPNH